MLHNRESEARNLYGNDIAQGGFAPLNPLVRAFRDPNTGNCQYYNAMYFRFEPLRINHSPEPGSIAKYFEEGACISKYELLGVTRAALTAQMSRPPHSILLAGFDVSSAHCKT